MAVSPPQQEAVVKVCCEILTLRIDSVVTSGQQVLVIYIFVREAVTVALAPSPPRVDERKTLNRSMGPDATRTHTHTDKKDMMSM